MQEKDYDIEITKQSQDKYDLNGESGMVLPKGRFGKWFENFWYHYKWHTIFTAFILTVVLVCTLQMCRKEEYDVHIIYAGGENVSRLRDGDISEYETLYKSFSEAVEDFDENGRIAYSLETMFMLTTEEIKAIEAELKEKEKNGEGSYELDYATLTENNKVFGERIQHSDSYVFLISEAVYRKYQKEATEESAALFVPIRDLAKDNSSLVFLDDSAVYLKSTKFGELPGLCDLPDDTLITLRSVGALSTMFDKNKTNEYYENSKKVISNILNYGY